MNDYTPILNDFVEVEFWEHWTPGDKRKRKIQGFILLLQPDVIVVRDTDDAVKRNAYLIYFVDIKYCKKIKTDLVLTS